MSQVINEIKKVLAENDVKDALKKIGIPTTSTAIEMATAYADCINDTYDKNILDDNIRNLHWISSKAVDGSDLILLFSKICPDYNMFNINTVKELVKYFHDAKFYPAREGSVCIYVKSNTKISSSDLEELGRSLNADEFSLASKSIGKVYRFWWD